MLYWMIWAPILRRVYRNRFRRLWARMRLSHCMSTEESGLIPVKVGDSTQSLHLRLRGGQVVITGISGLVFASGKSPAGVIRAFQLRNNILTRFKWTVSHTMGRDTYQLTAEVELMNIRFRILCELLVAMAIELERCRFCLEWVKRA